MAYARISEQFWSDDKIRGLTEDGRVLMLYLLTCQHRNRLGMFVLDPWYAAADLQWDGDRVKTALSELEAAERVSWDPSSRVVFIERYLAHNTLENGNVVKGAMNELGAVPDNPFLNRLLNCLESHGKGFYLPILQELRNRCANSSRDGSAIPGLTMPDLPIPEEAIQPPATPPSSRKGQAGGHPVEDAERRAQVEDALPTLRESAKVMHGGVETVRIHDATVGIGLEVEMFRELCAVRTEEPQLIAEAIRYVPQEADVDRATLKLLKSREDGPRIMARCIARALEARTAGPLAPEVPEVRAREMPKPPDPNRTRDPKVRLREFPDLPWPTSN